MVPVSESAGGARGVEVRVSALARLGGGGTQLRDRTVFATPALENCKRRRGASQRLLSSKFDRHFGFNISIAS